MAKSSIKDFEVLTRLGKGGFGTVFKVRRKADGNTYVLKLIPLEDLDLRGQEAAVNEVRILASLDHPYVVKYYDSFLEKKTLHIVMEYCDKGDLSSLIRTQMGRPLLESKIWKLFLQICLALEYLHGRRILHRDIKPMNVFLVRNDSIRIGDLGVAKRMGNSSSFAHTTVGTPYYLSPELCEDKPYNVKSDMWAFGCALYELCMLKHPFDASNQGALYFKIVRASYAPISANYSPELREIVSLCLSKDYKNRPSAASLLSRPGMRERALGLNLRIPGDSVLSTAVLSIPLSPSADREHTDKDEGLATSTSQRVASEPVPATELQSEIDPAVVRQIIDPGKPPEAPQRPVSRNSASKPAPIKADRPRTKAPARPSSVFQSRRTCYPGNQEYIEDVKDVMNLPNFTAKPKPAKEPLSAPLAPAESEEIKTEPWRPLKPPVPPHSPEATSPTLPSIFAKATKSSSQDLLPGKEVPPIQLDPRRAKPAHKYASSFGLGPHTHSGGDWWVAVRRAVG